VKQILDRDLGTLFSGSGNWRSLDLRKNILEMHSKREMEDIGGFMVSGGTNFG
jgi:hypothetical protein